MSPGGGVRHELQLPCCRKRRFAAGWRHAIAWDLASLQVFVAGLYCVTARPEKRGRWHLGALNPNY